MDFEKPTSVNADFLATCGFPDITSPCMRFFHSQLIRAELQAQVHLDDIGSEDDVVAGHLDLAACHGPSFPSL